MKLEPKAKPVRIRIKSGGEEHASLYSLKHNFCIEDIRPLLDNRLSRWLEQQGEKEIATSINTINVSSLVKEEDLFRFYKVFFREEIENKNIHSLSELAKNWSENTEYWKNSIYLNHFLLGTNIEAAKRIFASNEQYKSPSEWRNIFIKYKDTGDAELLYFLGKVELEGAKQGLDDFDIETSYNYILESAKAGYKVAIGFCLDNSKDSFLKQHADNRKCHTNNGKRFAGAKKEIIDKWLYSNSNWTYGAKLVVKGSDYTNEKERSILLFICHVQQILLSYNQKGIISALRTAGFDLDMPITTTFYKEKQFIIGLLLLEKGNKDSANSTFRMIQDYPPAAYMLSSARYLNGNVELKAMTFETQLNFIIRNLFDYE